MAEHKSDQLTTKTNCVLGNTNILRNFQSIKVTPSLKKALDFKLNEEELVNINLFSNPDFHNTDEKTNNNAEICSSSEKTKQNDIKDKFRNGVKKVIKDYREHREERIHDYQENEKNKENLMNKYLTKIHTIEEFPDEGEKIKQNSHGFRKILFQAFESNVYKTILYTFTFINVIVYCLYDFSDRIYDIDENTKIRNEFLYYIELLCNCFFACELIAYLLSYGLFIHKASYLRNIWNFINFVVVISSFLAYIPIKSVSNIFLVIRITRVIRIIDMFPRLKSITNSFVISIINSEYVFFNLLFFFCLFSTLGLNLFKGRIEYRCRLTPEPEIINNMTVWLVDESQTELCVETESLCNSNTYCGSAFERNLPWNTSESDVEALNFGISNFNNILYAFLSGLNFLTFTGWSNINDIYWSSYSSSVVPIYSVCFILIVGLILFQMLTGSIYQAFSNYRKGIKTFAERNHSLKNLKASEIKKISAEKLTNLTYLRNENTNHGSTAKKTVAYVKQNHMAVVESINKKMIDDFIHKKKFSIVMLLLVMLNIIILILDFSNDITSYSSYYCEIMELVLTLIFTLEICLKITINFKKFFSNIHDILDFLIIFLNIFEIIYEASINEDIFAPKNSSSAGIKSLKFLRIFRYIIELDYWKAGSMLFREMMATLTETIDFIIVVFIFVLLSSLYGMNIFAYTVRLDGEEIATDLQKGSAPRLNYDTFLESLMTTVLIFLNEEWHIIMFQYMRAFGNVAAIYFIFVLIFGTVLLMKMFIVLFINNFVHSNSIEKLIHKKPIWNKISEKLRHKFERLTSSPKFKRVMDHFHTDFLNGKEIETPKNIVQNEKNNIGIEETEMAPTLKQEINNKQNKIIYENNNHHQKKEFRKEYEHLLRGKSFCIFGPDNKFRIFLYKIITHQFFEKFIMFTIVLSCILLLLRDPFQSPYSDYNKSLIVTDYVILVIYCLEILMKNIAYGFLFNGPHSFLRKLTHFIDFALLGLTAIGTIDESISFSTVNLKPFRVLRFVKIIYFFKETTKSLNILILSIPELISVFFYFFLNLLFFGIIALKYFRDSLSYCTTMEEEMVKKVVNKWDCFDYGGDWINRDVNFDNIINSLSALFQISTTEGWMEIMFTGWDFVGKDMQPVENKHKLTAFFFIFSFLIANLVLMNMLIGVLVEKFLRLGNKTSPLFGLTDEQKEWALIKESIYRYYPRMKSIPPKNKIRRFLFVIIKHWHFKVISTGYTLLNGVIYMLFYNREAITYYQILTGFNTGFSLIFIVELIMRITALGGKFFKRFWNNFDFVIISASTAGIIYMTSSPFSATNTTFLSFLNVVELLRILRVIKKIPYLKKLFTVLKVVLPQVVNIAILLLTVVLIYGVLGVDLFVYLKPQSNVGGSNINFRDPFISMMNLVRCLTGENWYSQLSDCSRGLQPNFVCVDINGYDDYVKYGLNGCGKTTQAHLYFFSFIILVTLIILNLFVAMILTATEEITKIEELSINRYQLYNIKNVWRELDPEGCGFLDYKLFWRFTSKIAIIFGVKPEDLLDVSNKKNFLKALQLPVYEHVENKLFSYKYHDAVVALAKVAVMLKFQVHNLEPATPLPHLDKLELESRKDKNYIMTKYLSGDMGLLILLLRNIKRWRKRHKSLIICDIADIHFALKSRKKSKK